MTIAKPVRVVGNLPYNVASPILFKLLHDADDGRLLRDATLMLQKEVADRLVARPGSTAYGALAIQVALLADAERILSLPPGAFRPPPKVKSAVVRLRFRPPAVDVGDRRSSRSSFAALPAAPEDARQRAQAGRRLTSADRRRN